MRFSRTPAAWLAILCLATGSVIAADTVVANAPAGETVHVLLPGFTVQELPVRLSNQNNLRFAPDGSLTALGYDGRIWRLRDTDGDGLEDEAKPFWDQSTLSVPLGMAWSTEGLFVSSKGKVSLLRDVNQDGQADTEQIMASGWPPTDVGSGGVDATAVTLDKEGNLYFGLLVADYSNAYRLRKRNELKESEINWLKTQGRWREATGTASTGDVFSLYDLESPRGTIQKFNPRTRSLTTVATGIRVPVGLAINDAGDLFNTDQEGETWMPNGNPSDELNLIQPARNYGFPPPHPSWLPNQRSEEPVVAFGPQHQSACGLVFNEPHPAVHPIPTERSGEAFVALPVAPAQGLFGPDHWKGDLFVTGESRGKIWRVRLVKTANGYVGKAFTFARLSMLTVDVAISPRGELYVCCHSGDPDWGTGPQGQGRIFKISFSDRTAPQPLAAWAESPTEVRVRFDRPFDSGVLRAFHAVKPGTGSSETDRAEKTPESALIEFGEYVTAGDRFEVLKPPYAVVGQQAATPRGRLLVREARVEDEGQTLALKTDPHPLAVTYAITIPGVRAAGAPGSGSTVDLDYDLRAASKAVLLSNKSWTEEAWNRFADWAPKARASSGTDSREGPRPQGDWLKGRELFTTRLQCAKCHRIRGEGGLIGPDLSNLLHRDMASVLRDIREPSATIHPDYVTYQVDLTNGEFVTGFMRTQGVDAILLFDAEGKETRVSRASIADLEPTALSIMPAELLAEVSEAEVSDLLTFLLQESAAPASSQPRR